MTTITIPSDLAGRLDDEARRRGTTPELLALDGLRQFLTPPSQAKSADGEGTLFDFLNGYVGTIDGTTEPLSEDCGRRFAEGLAEKQQRETL